MSSDPFAGAGPVLTGTRLGKYEIREKLGRGGMGEVYLGYDPSLDCTVAVKVLAPHLVWQPEFVERFLREARSAARLKHPNIVTIHDVGQESGWYYFVMEYLEGRPLTDPLERGVPLAIGEVQDILTQLADALDYAHNRSDLPLIHRDVKPGNVMVAPNGHVTLTDFGIARAEQGTRLTRSGVVIGTPAYMSPEQALGQPVGKSSDQYALAVMAYEMLAGTVPFAADNTPALMYQVVHMPPAPLRDVRPDLPAAVERALGRALAKNPDERYGSCGEFVAALGEALSLPGREARAPQAVQPTLLRGQGAPPAGRVGTGVRTGSPPAPVAVGAGAGAVTAPPADRLNRILMIVLGVIGVLIVGLIIALIIASIGGPPDDVDTTRTALSMAATNAPDIEETVEDGTEFVSTDTPTTSAEPPPDDTATPTDMPPPDDTVTPTGTLITPTPTDTVVPTGTPTPSPTLTPTPEPRSPQTTGGRIAFTRKDPSHDDRSSEIWVLDVRSGGLSRLTSNSAVDHIPTWSPDGRQIAFTSNRGDNYDIFVMNTDGSGQQLAIGLAAWDEYPRWSPDGGRIAFVSTDQVDGVWNSEVFVATLGGGRERVTFNKGKDEWPSWSPDSGWLACSSDRDGDWDIYTFRADGSNIVNLTNDTSAAVQPAWSPDGQWIAFARQLNPGPDSKDLGNIWIGRTDRSDFRQLTFDGYALGPAWSPDGRFIVYSRYWDSTGDGKINLQDAADLMAVGVDGSGPYALTQGAQQDTSPQWGR